MYTAVYIPSYTLSRRLSTSIVTQSTTKPIEIDSNAAKTNNRLDLISYHLQFVRKHKLRNMHNLLFKDSENFYFNRQILSDPKTPKSSSVKTTSPLSRPKNMLSNHDLTTPGLEFTDFIAIDCEMVGTKKSKNTLARVSAVNFFGVLLYDAYVIPQSQITQWRTKWSGISPRVMKRAKNSGNLITFKQAQSDLIKILKDKFVVGHAVKHDLAALQINHPASHIIDTQLLPSFNKGGLKRLILEHYQIKIQTGTKGHSSIEDAMASMLLFRTYKDEFMDMLSSHNLVDQQPASKDATSEHLA